MRNALVKFVEGTCERTINHDRSEIQADATTNWDDAQRLANVGVKGRKACLGSACRGVMYLISHVTLHWALDKG